ncbi:MAG: NAD(P)/FAD-dependent oxidoreductase [Candidatus Scalinduaceae bacterium]
MSYVYDVVIIGAGPAGSSVAHHLSQQGVKNILLVDKSVFPRDKICAGGLSIEAQVCLDEMGILDEVKVHAYDVYRVYYITPYGTILKGRRIENPKPEMLVLRRKKFDNILLNHVRKLRVPVRDGMRIRGLWEDNGKICGVISTADEHIRAKIIVVATGANLSRFDLKRRQYIQAIGYMGWFERTKFEKNIAYMIYDKDFLPLYGWMFPVADDLVNIGIGLEWPKYSKDKIKEYLKRILSTYLSQYMKEAKPIGFARGFPFRYTYRIKDIVDRNILYVGEAGRIVSAFTGEGISQALISGRFAAHAISNYLNNNEQVELANYEKIVKRKYRIFPWLRLTKSFVNHKFNWRMIEMFQGKEGRLLL